MLNEDGTLTDTFIREVAAIPVGMIMPRASSAVPTGWLLCNGAEVDRVGTYAALFAVIGTAHGNGNGTTTFNLPNIQRKFLIGYDPADGAMQVGATGGEEEVTLTLNQIPAHTHPVANEVTDSTSGGDTKFIQLTIPVGTTVNSGSAGGDQPHNNIPPFLAVAWMIKY